MSLDRNSLQSVLRQVDMSAPAIQAAAGAMMKHYDRTAGMAINEWRSALHAASPDQLLPLLYVANEVLQTSKRNRGNSFLEAMSPVLSASLKHICAQDPSVTERVRRTVKIWADRRVFSIRFVNELLQHLEPYRGGRRPPPPAQAASQDMDGARFSPQQEPVVSDETSPASSSANDKQDDSDIRDILEDHSQDDDDDDDDEDMFGGSDDDDDNNGDIFGNTGAQKLEIDFSSALAATSDNTKKNKRRLSSPSGSPPSKRRSPHASMAVLSSANMMALWARLSELQERFDRSTTALRRIQERHEKQSVDSLSSLVGDELQQAYRQIETDRVVRLTEITNLHTISQERHSLQQLATRYIPWLESCLEQDEEELQLCDVLEQKLLSFRSIHGQAKVARDAHREKVRQQQLQNAERKRLEKEREEQEKFRQAVMAKETEAKPGMQWNPTTREYQALNTDESWRE